MEENQNTTNINGKKNDILPTEKPVISEIVFCGSAIRSVNIVIAENSICY
jgi:hypothetical protein